MIRNMSIANRNALSHASIFVAGLGLGLLANSYGKPVTAALLFMFAVVLIAARTGLRGGLLAGILASLAYNLLISVPTLRLELTNLDDFMPLLAFNISAVASAYVAGRLKDEARTSQEASGRIRSLLQFSGDLQTTVDLRVMIQAAQSAKPALENMEVRLDDGRIFGPAEAADYDPQMGCSAVGSERPVGHSATVVSEQFDGGAVTCTVEESHAVDAAAYLAIFAIAAERWVLTERLVEADVFRKSETFKTALLSSMSHDLRTPLSVISASAGSLLRHGEKLPAEDKQDLLETIEQQSQRLNQLTSKLLSLGRIEGGLEASSMPLTDALEVLGTALVTIRQLAPERMIRKAFSTKTAMVRADASILEQVIYNILENAVVHTPALSPIEVSVGTDDDTLVIGIEDRGSGVPAEEAEHVFERFHQAGPADQPKRGSGLGLSIARGFARAINGDVRLVPVPGGCPGARFEIVLPLAKGDRVL